MEIEECIKEYKILPEQAEMIRELAQLPNEEKNKILKAFRASKSALTYQKLQDALQREVFHVPSAVEDGLHWGKLQGLFMREADLVATILLAALGEPHASKIVREDLEKRKRNRKLAEELKKIIPEKYSPKIFVAWRGFVVAELRVPMYFNGRLTGTTTIEPMFNACKDGSIYSRFCKVYLVACPGCFEKTFNNIEELKGFFNTNEIHLYSNGWHDWVEYKPKSK